MPEGTAPAPATYTPADGTAAGIIKLAILAVGGQGGAVLTGWIRDLAESEGWHVQTTAVAGVAQRTGATIYYVEMAPGDGPAPVFALAPAPGDVDVLIAAEWMEAGRAVMRGFVTPDRTTVIASTHRALAVSEKIVPGDGRARGEEVAGALAAAARRVIAFDLEAPARAAGSVISASLFGALAGSGALPFPASAFEDTVRRSGRAIEASLAAFEAGRRGEADPAVPAPAEGPAAPAIPETLRAGWEALTARIATLPPDVRDMAGRGLRKVVDFQDIAYGAEYLDRLAPFVGADDRPDHRLANAAAKHIANAMAYDDVIRVADLKTRAARARRIRAEMAVADEALAVTEFLHPRIEEICGTLPARIGGFIMARPGLARWLDRRVNRGRRLRSDTVVGFLTLYLIAGLKRWRRATLRHRGEQAHLEALARRAREAVARDYDLAVEILACQRVVKGYGDTHARGDSKFGRLIGALDLLEGREDAADWMRRLREAALQDEDGTALDGALRTVASFTRPEPAPAPEAGSPTPRGS